MVISGGRQKPLVSGGEGEAGWPWYPAQPLAAACSFQADAGSWFSSQRSWEMAGWQMHFSRKLPSWALGVVSYPGAPG